MGWPACAALEASLSTFGMKGRLLSIAVAILVHPATAAVVLVLFLVFNKGFGIGNAVSLVAALVAFVLVCAALGRLWRRFVPAKEKPEDDASSEPVSLRDD